MSVGPRRGEQVLDDPVRGVSVGRSARAVVGAVVDREQGSRPRPREGLGHERRRAGRHDPLAVGRRSGGGRLEVDDRRQHLDEPVAVEAHVHLAEPVVGGPQPAEGQVVEQLVGHDHRRGAGGRHRLAHGHALDRLECPPRPGTALDGDNAHGEVRELRHQRAQQRAVACPRLDQLDRLGPAHRLVQARDPLCDELREDRMHVRARDEVARGAGADGRLVVVAAGRVQGELHEAVEAHRAESCDLLGDRGGDLARPRGVHRAAGYLGG